MDIVDSDRNRKIIEIVEIVKVENDLSRNSSKVIELVEIVSIVEKL